MTTREKSAANNIAVSFLYLPILTKLNQKTSVQGMKWGNLSSKKEKTILSSQKA